MTDPTTPSLPEIKARALQAIDAGRDASIGLAQAVMREPELGYREVRTARKVEEAFRRLGLAPRTGLALTGVKAVVDTGRPGPAVAVIGELDGLPIPEHPDCWSETGAVHACGHNAQLGSVLAAAHGLLDPAVLAHLSGRIVFFAVPAEESVEVEWRLQEKAAGRIEFLGGKMELLKLGEFDDVDMAMLVHTQNTTANGLLTTSESTNGHLVKFVRFRGRGAHAASPHLAINALKAATLAMTAIDAQRETFRDEDVVRIHPILTRGGDVVNAIPAEAALESFVRGKTLDAIVQANEVFDRCMRAGAMALGATVEITTMPGYLPLRQDPALSRLFARNARLFLAPDQVGHKSHAAASTDMGDLAHVMPTIQPSAAGATGLGHGATYRIDNWEWAVLNPGKAMALTVIDLLAADAAGAREILAGSRPAMTRQEYLAFLRDKDRTERFPASA